MNDDNARIQWTQVISQRSISHLTAPEVEVELELEEAQQWRR